MSMRAVERTLVFTDLVDSTLTVQRLGDAQAAQLWTEHDRHARALLEQHGGLEIDRSDGFFLLFDTAPAAAAFALAYHEAMAGLGLLARVGLHAGAVTLRENAAADVARGAKRLEVEGLAKPYAARIMALAEGGQTLLSASARQALGQTLPAGTEIEDHGHYRLKGIEAPAAVFELGRRGQAGFRPPADSAKAYRVVRAGELWRPVREVRHNLPAERDAFVGRAAELRALGQRLDAGSRLTTVLGPGGTGKTRFVRRYALAWLGDWPGGVAFCDLSEARSLDGVLFAVALALGVPLGRNDPVQQIGHAIAGRGRCLLILDNFEQVLAHAADTLGHWLDRAGEAAFVVTSRERLQLAGEELLPLEPLPLHGEAIELFEVRAQAQRPGFVIDDGNRSAVAALVRLLDGLPLAIELAAARIRVLAPAQIVERLKDRFALLAGARGSAARQATLRAAIDWSWDMLAPSEQAALAQCSVFEGGFTLEAAEAVLDLSPWPDAPPALDVVQALVDKSLLRSWMALETAGRLDLDQPFFGMYLSIHEYAAQKLADSGPGATRRAEERHGRYFASFGSPAAVAALSRHGGVRRQRLLALELDNLVTACRRAMARGDAATALPTYVAAAEVIDLQGPMEPGMLLGTQLSEMAGLTVPMRAQVDATRGRLARLAGRQAQAQAWLEAALQSARAGDDRPLEGRVLLYLGMLESDRGQMAQAREHLEASIAAHRLAGDRSGEATALANLGNVDLRQGRIDQARATMETALALHREVGNRLNEGLDLGNLAITHRIQCRFDEAQASYDAALAIHREVGNRMREGVDLGNLGNMHGDLGRYAQGRACYEAALRVHREVGSRRSEGIVLGNMGMALLEQEQFEPAAQCFEASLVISREVMNRQSEGLVLGMLGMARVNQGRWDEARACSDQSQAASRAAGDHHALGWSQGLRAQVLSQAGEMDAALAALDEGRAMLTEAGDRMGIAKLACVRVKLLLAAGQTEAARPVLDEAETIAVELDSGAESDLRRDIAALRLTLPRQ